MEIWKTLRVSHIPTPPATTTDNCPTRRYTNIPPGPKHRSGHEYDAAVTAFWGSNLAPVIEALYPFASYPFGGEALGASGTDGGDSCPARKADQLLSKF